MQVYVSLLQQQITFKGKKLKLGPAIMKERSSREFGSNLISLLKRIVWLEN